MFSGCISTKWSSKHLNIRNDKNSDSKSKSEISSRFNKVFLFDEVERR
jgi:hypothetical protein